MADRKLAAVGEGDAGGLAFEALGEKAETTPREMGERGDVTKRIHRGLSERGIERGAASYVLAGEAWTIPSSVGWWPAASTTS